MTGSLELAGSCCATYAFDVAREIDLVACERLLLGSERQLIKSRRRVPQYFQYQPAPLRMPQESPAVVDGMRCAGVEIVLYDFGAAAVNFLIPFAGPLDTLLELSPALQGNTRLIADARDRLARLIPALGPAVSSPKLAEVVEDYLIFILEPLADAESVQALSTSHAADLARVMRADSEAPSTEEVADILSGRMSFGQHDVTVVDWNAALVSDPDAEEIRMLLEFANVQLLELRHLDGELDRILEQAYDVVGKQAAEFIPTFGASRRDLARIAELQVDSAVLFERVTNALKLVGDAYLSRLYRLVSQRFRMGDWDRTITRKLEAIDGIYQKLSDRATSRRLELLEWIVIILIALEIVLTLIPRH